MNRKLKALSLLIVLSAVGLPSAARAADGGYTLSFLAGAGGSPDEDDPGLSNDTFALGFSVQPEDQVLVGLRLGQVSLDGGRVGLLVDTSIDYLTVGGEYRFTESFYESGFFIGLGLYQLDGRPFFGGTVSEEAIGFAAGITGEFEISNRFGFLVEITGHLANLDSVDTLLMGHIGLAYHF